MKNLPLICAIVGLVVLTLSVLARIQGGFLFSARGGLELAQSILLFAIALGVANQSQK